MSSRALLFLLLLLCPLLARAEKFDPARETFAFANDTLWAYSIDSAGNLHMHERAHAPEYTRRCFVMARAVIQFHRFVKFDPSAPKVSEGEYMARVRRISRIPVWMPQWGTKVVIPGYSDLRGFSKDYARPLEKVLGNWWPSYFRVGNWRMALPFPRALQQHLARKVMKKIDRGDIQAVFLTRFRPINHCVIAFDYKRVGQGNIDFLVYDPNNSKSPAILEFDHRTSSFNFGRTSYFNGGRVNAFAAYVAPWQ